MLAEKPVGRPSKYKPEYCEEIIKFFTVGTYRQVLVKCTIKTNGERIEEYEERGGDLKFLSQFARSIGVSVPTMQKWAKDYEEFFIAYNEAKELQRNHLIQNGIQGNYNAPFAIFTAKNITDMRDTPAVVIDQSTHKHVTVNYDKASESELIDALMGRVNGYKAKSS